jgi:hypothetical protein
VVGLASWHSAGVAMANAKRQNPELMSFKMASVRFGPVRTKPRRLSQTGQPHRDPAAKVKGDVVDTPPHSICAQ